MFLKQTAYKPRTNSQSSQGGQQDKTEAPKADAAPRKSTDMPTGPVSAAAAGRRRSSAAGAQYAGLNQHKRTSQDSGAKQAWTEQKAGGGILGGMWNSFTKGS